MYPPEVKFIQKTRFGLRVVEPGWLTETPENIVGDPSDGPKTLADDQYYTPTELPYRYFDGITQEIIPYSTFYNTILLPSSGKRGHACANSKIIEILSQELSPHRPTEKEDLGSLFGDLRIDDTPELEGAGDGDRSEKIEDTDDGGVPGVKDTNPSTATEDIGEGSVVQDGDPFLRRMKGYLPKAPQFKISEWEWDDILPPEYRREDDTGDSDATDISQDTEHPFQTRLKEYLSKIVQDESRKADDILGFLHGLFFVCRASGVQVCNNENCAQMKVALKRLMPTCHSWEGFQLWALQLAACICSEEMSTDSPKDVLVEKSSLGILPPTITSMGRDYYGFYPTPYLYSWSRLADDCFSWPGVTINDGYRDWADTVLLNEVYPVLSWLEAISTGDYKVPGGELPGGPLDPRILDGLGGLQGFKLCPHRVAVIATSLPGKELNISALLPSRSRQVPVPEHPTHGRCTYTECNEAIIDSTTFKQLHDCSNPNTCGTTQDMFPQDKLINATMNALPTAWTLDGLSLVNKGQPFMAISHVWADGTGVGSDRVVGVVNKCLWEYFCKIAIHLGCEGIWWDTICVPADREVRRIALNIMHTNYADAAITLVHDLYLRNFEWTDAESACFAVVMSTWYTRGWTALELAQSGRLEVLFKPNKNGFVIKNLDRDILAKIGEPSSSCHQVATSAIRSLRCGDILDKDTFLASFTPRYTSWVTDRLIIAGLLVGIEMPPSMDQEEMYERIREKLHVIESPKSERELDDCLFFQLASPDARSLDRLKNFNLARLRHLKRIRETPDLEERDPWDLVWPGWIRDPEVLRGPKNPEELRMPTDPESRLEYCWRVASCLACRPHLPDVFPQNHVENAISAMRSPNDLAYAGSKPLCDHFTRWSKGDQPALNEADLRELGFETPFWTSWCGPDWQSRRSDMLQLSDMIKGDFEGRRNK